jgi:hypothetical protein
MALADTLREVRVTCGDWERICSPGSMLRNGVCGVLLDPPYSQTESVYATDSNTVSKDVREWCKVNGTNPMIRIALCGHQGEHEELEGLGWSVETWHHVGGYQQTTQGIDKRERIWFSPGCLKPEVPTP